MQAMRQDCHHISSVTVSSARMRAVRLAQNGGLPYAYTSTFSSYGRARSSSGAIQKAWPAALLDCTSLSVRMRLSPKSQICERFACAWQVRSSSRMWSRGGRPQAETMPYTAPFANPTTHYHLAPADAASWTYGYLVGYRKKDHECQAPQPYALCPELVTP